MKRAAVALIDEARCIGCARCIEACPVDAIVGAARFMHTVVDEWCIGCRLCVPPCPVDCIAMVAPIRRWTPALKEAAGRRARRRRVRLARAAATGPATSTARRREIVAGILARRRKT